MTETTRLPPIPDELTSNSYDPTTKIRQTPDGNIEVHSLRSGTESKITFGPDGSYKLTTNTGTTISFSSNNELRYQKGGFTLTVDNHCDIKIAGHGRINVDGDSHIEVAKDASIVVNGMTDIYSTAHVKMTAADIYLGSTKGSIVLNAARDIEFTAGQGRLSAQTSGVMSFVTTSGDFHVAAAGMVDLNSQLDSTITSQGNFNANAQAITTTSQGATNINASGNITTQGAATLLQGGGVASPPITVS